MQVSFGAHNDSFSRLVTVPATGARLAVVGGLPPETVLRFRYRAVSRTSFGLFRCSLALLGHLFLRREGPNTDTGRDAHP